MPESRPDRLDPEQYLGLVRAALDPDERKFFKQYLGQEGPDISDYLFPGGGGLDRFNQARELREGVTKYVLGEAMKPRATYDEANAMFPGSPWSGSQPGQPGQAPMQPGATGPGPAGAVGQPMVRPPIGPMDLPAPPAGLIPQDNLPQGIPGGQKLPSTPHMGMLAEPQQGYPNEPTDQAAGITPPGMPGPMSAIPRESYQPGPAGQPMGQPGGQPGQPQPEVYQPLVPKAPPGAQPAGQDMSALLPRSYQSLLEAKTHREGLRGIYGRQPSNQMQMLEHYKALESGQSEEAYAGEKDMLKQMLVGTRTAPTGSAEGRNKEADAATKEAKLPYAGAQAGATLDKTRAETEGLGARTETENVLRDAKLAHLESQINLDNEKARLAGSQKGTELAKERTLKFQMLKYANANNQLSDEEFTGIANSILEGTDLEATPEEPSAIRKFFGLGSSGTHIGPRKGGKPMAPPQGSGPSDTPAIPKADNEQSAVEKGRQMKEGESMTYKGHKYIKKGNKLEKVK